MSVILGRVGALVHESARGNPAERMRHERFLLTRIMAGFLALSCLPPYLLGRGVPSPLESLAILCLAAPLFAAILLSRGGRWNVAQTVSGAALLGLMACFLSSAVGLSSPVILWIALPAVVGHALALALLHMHVESTTEVARRSCEARDRSLLTVMDDLVTWHDRNGHVIRAVGGSEKLLSLAPSVLRGRGFFSRVHVSDRPAFLKAFSDATTSERPVTVQFRIHVGEHSAWPVGSGSVTEPRVIWGEMRVARVDDCGEGDPCTVAVTRDISALARHADELREARAEADRVGAAKGQFLAMVSHELRTPLNAIIGFSEVLASETAPPVEPERRKEYLDIIRSSGEHLLQVVNTLLDVSKIEAGKFDVLPEPFEISSFAHSCCDLMGLKAERGGILLARDIAADLPELIADRRACKQMLINLLSNAIKFTPAGGTVTVTARRDCDHIVFIVSDTGIGIAENDLPKLGNPFFQARAAYDRRHEGTGLGLSVVRGLVGLHHGSLTVESAPDEGTSVTISLPIDCRTGPSRKPAPVRIHALPRALAPARALRAG